MHFNWPPSGLHILELVFPVCLLYRTHFAKVMCKEQDLIFSFICDFLIRKIDYALRPLLIIWVLLFWIMFLYLYFSYFILVQLLFSYYLEGQCILYINPSSVVFTHMHTTNIFPILSYFVRYLGLFVMFLYKLNVTVVLLSLRCVSPSVWWRCQKFFLEVVST